MAQEIDFWSTESKLYAILDAQHMRSGTSYRDSFVLGPDQKADVALSSKTGSPISLHQPFRTAEVDFSLNFRASGSPWLRVDNQANHGFLHLHLKSGTQTFDEHIPVPEVTTVSGLIAQVFNKAEETIKWKCPEIKVISGAGFVGFA